MRRHTLPICLLLALALVPGGAWAAGSLFPFELERGEEVSGSVFSFSAELLRFEAAKW
jgi:hypothetical protein